MEPRISLLTLGVANIAKARAFYEKLGWRASSTSNEHVVFFHGIGTSLALFGRESLAEDAGIDAEGSGFRGSALAYNVREKEEVARVLEEARQAGGTIVKPAADTFWGGHSGYFADGDGHLWEVAWNPFFPISADGSLRLP